MRSHVVQAIAVRPRGEKMDEEAEPMLGRGICVTGEEAEQVVMVARTRGVEERESVQRV